MIKFQLKFQFKFYLFPAEARFHSRCYHHFCRYSIEVCDASVQFIAHAWCTLAFVAVSLRHAFGQATIRVYQRKSGKCCRKCWSCCALARSVLCWSILAQFPQQFRRKSMQQMWILKFRERNPLQVNQAVLVLLPKLQRRSPTMVGNPWKHPVLQRSQRKTN